MVIKELFDLTGQTAIITGGGGGLGRQIAIGLSQAGANVVVCSRNLENCKKVKKEILNFGGNASAFQVDVRDESSVKKLVSDVLDSHGSIEILVNCSGVSQHVDATEMSLETWNRIVDTNLTGVFLMSKIVGKQMVENRNGKIINISSVGGFRGYEPENHNSIAYTSSKGAVNTLTKDLAVKWGPYGVYVNAVAPGIFLTNMNKSRLASTKDKLAKDIPLRKLGGEKDLIGAVLYFASAASNHTTGQILAVDGGSSSK